TQFQNSTPPLTDSNIVSWNWQFGDTGTSSQQTPTHTYSSANVYTVTLLATSNKGCQGSVSKPVSISASPSSNFTVGPSCLNTGTTFTDASSGNIQSRLWQIASSTFSTP